MARRREEADERVLERGEISLMYRPRVEQWQPEDVGDVQRLLLVLCPERRSRYRVVAIGRKRLPDGGTHDRFWGYVDLVLDSPTDLRAALGAHTYKTKTRGLRHLPAARNAGRGRYEVTWHDGHAHLKYELTEIESNDPVVDDLHLEPGANYIVTVANPDPTMWGLLETPQLQFDLFDEPEIHVTIPSPFPPSLQARFGDRRFVGLDSVAYLDHPGAELVFVATA
jgi:hypothetical protein